MATNWFFSFLFLFHILSVTSVSASKVVSYSDHCASMVAESPQTVPSDAVFPISRTVFSHYTGGDPILSNLSSVYFSDFQKYVSFRPVRTFKTRENGIYKIEANLLFRASGVYNSRDYGGYYGSSYYSQNLPRKNSLRFQLNGFWSEHSETLCMVGSASWYSREGKRLNLEVVLNLKYAMKPTINTSVITGTLASLSSPNDPAHFDPVSIWIFSETRNYDYTLACLGGTDSNFQRDQLLDLEEQGFCSTMQRLTYNTFELNHSSGSLTHLMFLNLVQCSEEKHKVRYLIRFGNDSYGGYYREFDLNSTLVAEGSWDKKMNQLCVVACRILNPTNPMAYVHVGDCSTRLSLKFPAVWSIRSRLGTLGQIWSTKLVNESGYFEEAKIRSYREYTQSTPPGLRYNYTEIGRENYPEGSFYDMRFDMSIKDHSGRKLGWGYANPLFVGEQSYHMYEDEVESNFVGLLNMSFVVTIPNLNNAKPGSGVNSSLYSSESMKIYAEGIYNEETGKLCLVGCRNLHSEAAESTDISMDCEILLKFQFPPINSKKGGFIEGTIESLRKNDDPLFFKPFNMSSTAFNNEAAWSSIWRMDLEIAIVLISNTFACIFLVLQLFYVKKNPEFLPLTSLLMLFILILGYALPLILNFEALFSRANISELGSETWGKAHQGIVRAVTLVAFFLQFRLLQLTLSARRHSENQKALWLAEKKTLVLSLPLYIAGMSIVWLLNLNSGDSYHPLLGALRSYGGLVLDGFLLPQILLNVFRISSEKALSNIFYMGTTLIRLLPHAYDLYRAQSYGQIGLNEPYYIYADHSTDLYSTAWDVIICCGGIFLAGIVFLQQKFGGRCFLPQRFKAAAAAAYEKHSESLRMVGFASWYSREGKCLNLEVVLNLKYAMKPMINTSVITVTPASLSFLNDPAHFDLCSEEKHKARYLIRFGNNRYGGYYQEFDLNSTLVVEGSWDEKMNQLCIVACKILNPTNPMAYVHMVDCSTRLGTLGQIWSTKFVKESGYFKETKIRSFQAYTHYTPPGLRYNYTKIGKVKILCPNRVEGNKKKENYPEGSFYDMSVDMSIKDHSGRKLEATESTNLSIHCEILLKFQFPPINSRKGVFIEGTIESLRKNDDPLFFKPLNMSSTAFNNEATWSSIWWMDLEIAIVLISNTFTCIFLVLQLFYAKQNPEFLYYTLKYQISRVLSSKYI
ncbi:hypothetical protein NMG60_11003427 [Bertholletia excelsa]